MVLFSLVFLVPTGAFAEITEATVTLEKSLEVDAVPREATPRGLEFNDDGTKMYFVGGTRDIIYEYLLATPFDIETAVNSNSHKSTAGVDSKPRSITFQDNGKRMLLAGVQNDKIYQYTLKSGGTWAPFDVSTASHSGTKFDPNPEINDWGITWSTDGTKLFVTGSTGGTQKVFQYGFTTPFLIGTYDGNGSVEFDLEFDAMAREIEFNPDGTKMFVLDSGSIPGNIANVYEFELSTGFDIQTASKIISQTGTTSNFSVLNEEVRARGLAFSNDGTKMYITGITGLANDANPDIHQYSLSCPWQLTGTCGEEEKGSSCWDCTRPAITYHGHSETPDGFSINDAIFENNQELYNENPTIEATVGDMVTIKARAWDNRGPENIVRVYTYLGMYEEKPNWHESEAYIEYNIKKDKFEVNDKNKIFALVGASSEVAVNPHYEDGKLKRPLELLDITFTIIFAKPMEPSHIAIQTIDDAANYELVYFEDALKIKEKEILEIPEEVPEEVIPEVPEEVIPEVPEEVIPEPEPPVKEPEPEIMLTATSEKTILSFVNEDMPAKHYVKRYITEQEYKEWFDVNYSEYQFWEGIGITQERFNQIKLEIESEPKPKMIQTGFVLVPDNEVSFPLVEEKYEPEPVELEPVKEKKGFFDWLFSLLG